MSAATALVPAHPKEFFCDHPTTISVGSACSRYDGHRTVYAYTRTADGEFDRKLLDCGPTQSYIGPDLPVSSGSWGLWRVNKAVRELAREKCTGLLERLKTNLEDPAKATNLGEWLKKDFEYVSHATPYNMRRGIPWDSMTNLRFSSPIQSAGLEGWKGSVIHGTSIRPYGDFRYVTLLDPSETYVIHAKAGHYQRMTEYLQASFVSPRIHRSFVLNETLSLAQRFRGRGLHDLVSSLVSVVESGKRQD